MSGERSQFATWEEKRDELRRRLAARRPRWDHAGPVRPVDAEVVESHGVVTQVLARARFLEVASEVAPEMLVDLAGRPLDEFDRGWQRICGPEEPDVYGPYEPWPAFMTMVDHLAMDPYGQVAAWCRRWNLPTWGSCPIDLFVAEDRVLARHTARVNWAPIAAVCTLSYWRVRPLNGWSMILTDGIAFAQPPEFGDRNLGLERSVALPSVTWNPQFESRAAASNRILAAVRSALQSELDRIEAETRTEATRPALNKRMGLEHFAWLARYQFRRDRITIIARAAHREPQSVIDAIRDAAYLVGLPLRDPDPKGRPPKQPDAPRSVRFQRSRR